MIQNIINDLETSLPYVSEIGSSGVAKVPGRLAQELAAWDGKNEHHPEMQPRLAAYWNHIDYGPWNPDVPWSASFVSWIMRNTGFPESANHRTLVEEIIAGNHPQWKAYSIPKNLSVIRLSPGDILVEPRGKGAPPNDPSGDYWISHSSIVYRIAGNRAELVGGNVGNTVKIEARIPVDAEGYPLTDLGDYKIILKREKKNGTRIAIVLLGLWAIWRIRK